MSTSLTINGEQKSVEAPDDMPLLWVLRDLLGMTGTKFGCGIAQCGACTVHIDGKPVRSCMLPVGAVGPAPSPPSKASAPRPSARKVQKAWLDLEVVQCGYCQSGQIMSAAALLASHPHPDDADIDAAMAGNICRCGTYVRIRPRSNRPLRTPDRRSPRWSCAMTPGVSRRVLLTGGLAGGFRARFHLPLRARATSRCSRLTIRAGSLRPNAFIRIDAPAPVTLVMPQVEMGQGVYTAIAMILAEELDADFAQVSLQHAPPNDKLYGNPLFGIQVTGNSNSIRSFWKPLRDAGRDRARHAGPGCRATA